MICYVDRFSKVVSDIRKQRYESAVIEYNDLFEEIKNELFFINSLANNEKELINIICALMSALEDDDPILLADIIVESLIPWIKGKIEYAEASIYGDYSIEATSSGATTIKYLPLNLYLHSNVDPFEEGRILIDHCTTGEKNKYAVWGLGWGYHILPLIERSQGASQVAVFEPDCNLIALFEKKSLLNFAFKENIQIIHDPSGLKFASYLSENNVEVVMHFPSVKKIENDEIRTSIKRFYSAWNGIHEMADIINANISYNIDNATQSVDVLEGKFTNKKVVIVGAGPSVDANIDILRGFCKDDRMIIIASASITSVLLSNGIIPDYLCAIDPTQRSYLSFRELKHNIPYIISSAAYWEIASNSNAECFIAFTEGNRRSENEAKKKGCKLFSTGGTVISLAVDVAVKLGAREIGLVGIDFAFLNGNTHAKDTYENSTIRSEKLIEVRSVSGELIYTNEVLLSYLKWLEREIEKNKEVCFYNYSKTGAFIRNTIPGDEFDY